MKPEINSTIKKQVIFRRSFHVEVKKLFKTNLERKGMYKLKLQNFLKNMRETIIRTPHIIMLTKAVPKHIYIMTCFA